MKRFLLFAAVIAAVALTGCSKDDDGAAPSGVNGKQITVKEYEWKFGEKATWSRLYEQYRYDNNGNLVEKKTKHRNRVGMTYSYIYDAENHLVEMKEDGGMVYIHKYTSNSIDSIATMQKYSSDGRLLEKWEYTYDSQNRLLQAKQTYEFIGGVCYIEDYSYNGNDVTIVRRRADNGELFSTSLYEYDNYNNLEKEIYTNGETGGEAIQKWNEYTYNSKGQITRKIEHDYPSLDYLMYKDYTYNDDGSIHNIHVSYNNSADQFDLEYEYSRY